MSEYAFDIIDSLPIVDGAYSNHFVIAVGDILTFSDSANTKAIYKNIGDALTFRQYNPGARPVRLSITDFLVLSQTFSRTYFVQFYDVLSFSQTQVFGRPILHVSDVLNIVQIGWVYKSSHALSISDSLIFTAAFDATFPLHCDGPQYPTITLSGIGAIELRAPIYGNKSTLNQTRVQKNTRGGDLVMFSAKHWPKDELVEYEFEAMNQDIRQLQTFVNRNLGKMITVTDFDGLAQQGIITADPEIKQTGRGCQFSGTLQFQRLFS